MRASTKRTEQGQYRGVVLDDKGKPLCMCTHLHRNRDMNSWDYQVKKYVDGKAALTCANELMACLYSQEIDPIDDIIASWRKKS